MNLIFKISEGGSLVAATRALALRDKRKIERLHDIGAEVAEYRRLNPARLFSRQEAPLLFDAEILPLLSPEKSALYRTYIVRDLTKAQAARLRDHLENGFDVDFVQYDEENRLYSPPNDPAYGQQWGMPKIQVETAWAQSQGDGVIVAVVDTGVDYANPDLAQNMWKDSAGKFGFDFSNNTPNPLDYDGHGTHVAGIIAAVTNNGQQVAGVAPRARIMAVKVFPQAYDSRCAAGIKYAVDNGARVINNSWGPGSRRPSNPVVEDAVNYAHARGVIVVFAAGNASDDVQHYAPANLPRVISVAASDSQDRRGSFSNYGAVTVAAPGVNILSLRLGSTTPVGMSGTSMAAPFVAGAAALYLKLNPTAGFETIRKNLQQTGDVIATDQPVGRRLNLGRFVVKVPPESLRIEQRVNDSYKGVTGCAARAQKEAANTLARWIEATRKKYPDYRMLTAGHKGGQATTSSGIDYWTQKRWCKTKFYIDCYMDLWRIAKKRPLKPGRRKHRRRTARK